MHGSSAAAGIACPSLRLLGYLKRPHRHTPRLERRVNLMWERPLLEQEQGLPRVYLPVSAPVKPMPYGGSRCCASSRKRLHMTHDADGLNRAACAAAGRPRWPVQEHSSKPQTQANLEHAIADETEAVSCQHWRLAQSRPQIHRCDDTGRCSQFGCLHRSALGRRVSTLRLQGTSAFAFRPSCPGRLVEPPPAGGLPGRYMTLGATQELPVARVSAEECAPLMFSSSGITFAGEKKCMPTVISLRRTPAKISSTSSVCQCGRIHQNDSAALPTHECHT